MMRRTPMLVLRSLWLPLFLVLAIACGSSGGGSGDDDDNEAEEPADDDDDGGGPVGFDFGELVLSGDDVASDDVNDGFDPILASAPSPPPIVSVIWGSTPGIQFGLLVVSGEVDNVFYQQGVPGSPTGELFFYRLECLPLPAPPACSDIVLDLAGESISFDEVDLPIVPALLAPNNIATAPLTVDGTLNWESP